MTQPIPPIDDRRPIESPAGDQHLANVADLLDFDPVPRRPRVDGWTPEAQRAFMAALAVSGSPRRACAAVGKAPFGADQLRKAKGNEGFLAAWDRAMAIARDKEARRLSDGVGAVNEEDDAWRPPPAPWSHAASRRPVSPEPAPAPDDADSEKARLEWLAGIVRKYLLKLGQEREARLAGQIVAADFYVRQLTHIEVMLDLMGGGGFAVLAAFREQGHHLVDIAETPLSRLLDNARRDYWSKAGEPPRPEHPPRRYLVDHGGFATEPLEHTRGGLEQSHQEQWQAFKERHARDAAAQLEWEARARQDYDRRRASDAES